MLQPGQRRYIAEGLAEPVNHLRAAVPDRRCRQLVPVPEIVVELALARLRGGQHLVHAGARDPALGEQVRGPLYDPLPAGAPAPGSRLTWHAPMLSALYQTVQYVRPGREGDPRRRFPMSDGGPLRRSLPEPGRTARTGSSVQGAVRRP